MTQHTRLIAKDPELVKALEEMMESHTWPMGCECAACDAARALLKEIEG